MKFIKIRTVVKISPITNQESFLYNPTYQLTFLRQIPLSSTQNVFFVKAGEQRWCFCLKVKVCISCNCVFIRCYKVWCFTCTSVQFQYNLMNFQLSKLCISCDMQGISCTMTVFLSKAAL